MKRSSLRAVLTATALCATAAGAVALYAATRPPATSSAAKPAKALPLVSVAVAKRIDLPTKVELQGHGVPLAQVEIRPQRTATLRGVHFREGEEIRAGQLLFTLDAADAAAQLDRAEAQAAQTRAQLQEARREHERASELANARYVSQSAVATSASKAEVLQGQLDAALADIRSARVQIERARIVAPIAGRAGAVKVHAGSLVQQGDAAALTTIVQFDPIGIEFVLPESRLAEVLAAQSAAGLSVSARTDAGAEIRGRVVFIDNAVDRGTGTIGMKAVFENGQRSLWPGAFVRVTLGAGLARDALALPPQAVVEGPEGHFVFIVDDAGAVASRPVRLLRIQERLAVIEGLQGGERVVLEGHQGLKVGTLVKAVEAAGSAS